MDNLNAGGRGLGTGGEEEGGEEGKEERNRMEEKLGKNKKLN